MVTDSLKFLTPGMMSLLKDGQWHRFGEFIPIVNQVPPEIAQRTYVRSRGNKDSRIHKSLESQADSGRMVLLKSRLRGLVQGKHIFVRGENEEAEYMSNPESKGPIPFRDTPDSGNLDQVIPIAAGVSNICDMSDLKGRVWLTAAEFIPPEQRAFGEIRKRGRRKHVSVMPVLVTMLQIKGTATLVLKLRGDKVVVEDIK